MKISERFQLDKSQFELDFIDIDSESDIPLFIESYLLENLSNNSRWAEEAYSTIYSFFSHFLELLKSGEDEKAKIHLEYLLEEPKESCLGLSLASTAGKSCNRTDINKIIDNVLNSKAISSGIVEDLEDFRIFIPNIDKDKMSDITTVIIREHLIKYTKEQCELNDIPLTKDVISGYYWDSKNMIWTQKYCEMLIINEKKILLTPKRIVTYSNQYTAGKYINHFVLNFLQSEHIRGETFLVKHRKKTGMPYVTKKSIIQSSPKMDKNFLIGFTEKYPQVFKKFKSEIINSFQITKNEDLTNESLREVINHLMNELQLISIGKKDADKYHKTMIGILELLFYPHLCSPRKEYPKDEGRKRVDIVYSNYAESGFFFRLGNSYGIPCSSVFVECKNYVSDIGNPELDQLSGRFNVNKGKVGLLLCRQIDEYELLIKRCQDTLRDQRGLIIPLTDKDIIEMLTNYYDEGFDICEKILMRKYMEINI